jgi:hypothetical protein
MATKPLASETRNRDDGSDGAHDIDTTGDNQAIVGALTEEATNPAAAEDSVPAVAANDTANTDDAGNTAPASATTAFGARTEALITANTSYKIVAM